VLDGLVDLAAMDRDLFGRIDPQADLVAADLHHGHRDVIVDDDAFVLLPRENQHRLASLQSSARREIGSVRWGKTSTIRCVRRFTPSGVRSYAPGGANPHYL